MNVHVQKTLVLCEGKEDKLVMQCLAQHAKLEAGLAFEDYGGETNLRSYLANLKVSPEYAKGEYRKILVTRDADRDFDSAWQSVRNSIENVFSHTVMEPGDWVRNEDGVLLSAWVIPGPGQSGMIETLCLDAARATTPEIFDCLDPFMECIGTLHTEAPHEKVRFALWTIIAQGKTAKDRLSVERALKQIPISWENEAFHGLRKLLEKVAS